MNFDELWHFWPNDLKDKRLSEEERNKIKDTALKIYQILGCCGLAMDLGLNEGEIDFLCPYFPYEGICQKFREKSLAYGFIQRYQKDKENITLIAEEPWHFRFVGYPHSQIMYDKNLSLEEYILFLKRYLKDNPLESYGYKIYFWPWKGTLLL